MAKAKEDMKWHNAELGELNKRLAERIAYLVACVSALRKHYGPEADAVIREIGLRDPEEEL